MARTLGDERPASVLSQQLLLSLAEQLKVPFLQIARQAELSAFTQSESQLVDIIGTANGALKLLDNYILGVRFAQQSEQLFDMEPVSVSSVLYDATAELLPVAKSYGISLDLDIGGKFTPVMANHKGLQAALVSLGYALIEALPAAGSSQLRLQFSAHRCRYGVVAGIYCDAESITAQTLRQGRQLHGQAQQPLTQLSHSSGAGIFVADALLQAMQSQLTTSRHHNLRGLGVVLQPNPQLQLV